MRLHVSVLVLTILIAPPASGALVAVPLDVEPELLLVGLAPDVPLPSKGDAWAGGRVTLVAPEIRAFGLAGVPDALASRIDLDPRVEYAVRNDADAIKLDAVPAPSDPFWSWQWGPERIRLLDAWETTRGSRDVIVAVLDTGLTPGLRDFQGVNVLQGVNTSGLVLNADVTDVNGVWHGTHVTGTVAARIDNGVGIAGVADVTILPVKVLQCGAGTLCTTNPAAVGLGILEAARRGADVITMSLGGGDNPFMNAAVKYADAAGIFLVASAGNAGCVKIDGCVHYPAAYPEVMAIGCSNQQEKRCSFGNADRNLDMMAPGQDILSTSPHGDQFLSGTSMSTPHVAGVAALLLSVRPDATPMQVKGWLLDGAADVSHLGMRPIEYGAGRLDAAESLRLALAS